MNDHLKKPSNNKSNVKNIFCYIGDNETTSWTNKQSSLKNYNWENIYTESTLQRMEHSYYLWDQIQKTTHKEN